MERLMKLALRHPKSVIFWVVIVTIAAALQLPQLRSSVSPQSLVVTSSAG